MQDEYYKEGKVDGCKSAAGDYIKKHALFQNNRDYRDGWIAGRKKCNPSYIQAEKQRKR